MMWKLFIAKVMLAVAILVVSACVLFAFAWYSFPNQDVPRTPGLNIPTEIAALIAINVIIAFCCIDFLNENGRTMMWKLLIAKVMLAVAILVSVCLLFICYSLSPFASQEVPRPPGLNIPIEIAALLAINLVVSFGCLDCLNRIRQK